MIRQQTAPPTVRRLRDIPPAIGRLDTIDHPDYADVFTAGVDGPVDMPVLQWIRAVLRTGPLDVRLALLFAVAVQRVVLGLRTGRGQAHDVMGWHIAACGEDWARLEATSWLMTGHLVLQRDSHQVSGATFVRYEHRLAAYIWPVVATAHRRVARILVRHAATVR